MICDAFMVEEEIDWEGTTKKSCFNIFPEGLEGFRCFYDWLVTQKHMGIIPPKFQPEESVFNKLFLYQIFLLV